MKRIALATIIALVAGGPGFAASETAADPATQPRQEANAPPAEAPHFWAFPYESAGYAIWLLDTQTGTIKVCQTGAVAITPTCTAWNTTNTSEK
jgi:hypothetical protein